MIINTPIFLRNVHFLNLSKENSEKLQAATLLETWGGIN